MSTAQGRAEIRIAVECNATDSLVDSVAYRIFQIPIIIHIIIIIHIKNSIMKNKKIVNSLTYEFDSTCVEHPTGISQTIPDDALPLKELVEKHTRGQGVPQRTPVFLGDMHDFPDVGRLTPMQLIDIMRDTEKTIEMERKNLQKLTEEKKLREVENQLAQEEAEKTTTKKAKSIAKSDNAQEEK